MTDQEVLDAYVTRYGWEWCAGDMAYRFPTELPAHFIMLTRSSKYWWDVFVLDEIPYHESIPVDEHLFLYANPSVEGRLREKLGLHFYALQKYLQGEIFKCIYDLFDGHGLRGAEANTAIQAYIAALETVEVSDGA